MTAMTLDQMFPYKVALEKDAQAHGYMVEGMRCYHLVDGETQPLKTWGAQARATLKRCQTRYGLEPTGILNAPTRAKLIPPKPNDHRAGVVKWARWGVANAASIHYSQGSSRMAAIGKPGHLPLETDCSAWFTLCYNWEGAPDPNGRDYDGFGYTGTLIAHGKTVATWGAARPGDAVIFGAGTGHHVAMVVEAGADPLLVSHGQESDPRLIRLSAEAAGQARSGHGTVTIKSYLA